MRREVTTFDRPREVDFVVDSGGPKVLVEVRAGTRPRTLTELGSMRVRIPLDPALIVISRRGFGADPMQWPNLFMVTWRTPEDDAQLATALQGALAPAS